MEELPTKEAVVAFLIDNFNNEEILRLLQDSGVPRWITELNDLDRFLICRNSQVIQAWQTARSEFESWCLKGGE